MRTRTDGGNNVEISLGALLAKASRGATGKERIPTDGTIELTRRCNFRCVHCYIGDARWKPDPNELSKARIIETLDVLAERGTLWITFTGGEALLHPSFREIWLHAKQKGFIVSLFTNAALIDDAMADFLVENPPHCLEVSIYGATRETFERVTLNRHSFDRFFRAVELIRARGFKWLLKAPVIPGVSEELPQIRALAESWGVQLLVDGAINPSIGEGESGGKAPCASRVSAEELFEHEFVGKDRMALGELLSGEMEALPAPSLEGEELYNCGAGKSMFYLTAAGQLQMCALTGHRGEQISSERPVGASFDLAWEKFGEARKIKMNPGSPCAGCDLSGICKSCPGFSHLENGDEQKPVEWLCRSTHLRAHKLGLPHKCDIKHFVYSPIKRI